MSNELHFFCTPRHAMGRSNDSVGGHGRSWHILASLLLLFVVLVPHELFGATTTYNFEDGIKAWYKNVHVNDVSLNLTNNVFDDCGAFTFGGKFGSSDTGDWHLRSRGSEAWGLQNTGSGSRNFQILDLQNGDIVEIYGYNGYDNGREYDLVIEAQNNTNYSSYDATTNTYKFIMKADGALSVNLGRKAMVRSVTIQHDDTTPSISFSSSSATGELSSLDFPEPTLITVPQTATVTFSTANPKLLRVDENGEVFMINSGVTSVTATMVVGGQTYSASYDVKITAEDALYELTSSNNGLTNTYTFTGAGKLPNRNVKDVPGLNVEMGTFDVQPQTTIVREDISGVFTATTLDVNGYRHLWANVDGNVITPYQGTFYTLKPTSNGKLTMKGRVQGNYGNNKVLLIEKGKELTDPLASLTAVDNDALQTLCTDLSLEAGKTYYVYGLTGASEIYAITGDEDYVTFELNSFTYTIDNYFQNSKEVDIHAETATNGCKTYTTTCHYSDRNAQLYEYPFSAFSTNAFVDESYSAADFKFKGNVTGADISFSNGQIVFSNITYNTDKTDEQGGAIITRVGTSKANSILFVLTIPYGKHTWFFQSPSASSETVSRNKILANTATFDGSGNISDVDVYLTYMVRTYEDRVLTYLKDPVWANVTPVKGTNAFYIDQTAGLVFNTQAGSFGARCMDWSVDQNSMTNEERRDQQMTNATRNSFVSWHTTNMNDENARAKLTIPQLKKGWFVRIWWNPESNGNVGSGGAGVQFLADNLTDLDGKEVDSDFHITGSVFGNDGQDNFDNPNFYGNTIFRVKEDGDVTISLHDNGWNDLIKIEVSDSYATDFIFSRYMDGKYREVWPTVYNNCFLSHKKGEEAQLKLEGANHHHGESARSPIWSVVKAEGVTEGTDFTLERKSWTSDGRVTYYDGYLTAKSGYGCVLLRQDMIDVTGNYVTDRREGWFAIGEYEVQDYPYTWDFTQYNLGTDVTETMTSLEASDTDDEHYGKWLSDDGLDIFAFVDAQSKSLVYYDSKQQKYLPLTIEKPLFAKNSQLTINYTPIPEAVGLRVNTEYAGWQASNTAYNEDNIGPFNHHVMLDGKKMTFNNPNMSDAANDENAKRASYLTIPEVPAGMYVFVKADKEPTVKIAGKDASLSSDFDAADGVFEYKVETKGDVEITFPGTPKKNEVYNVEAIGVTNISKSTNRIGYATESRNVPIDHVYTGTFTLHDVNAYAVLNYNDGYDLEGIFLAENAALVEKSKNDINVIPANTGIVLYDADAKSSTFPLFYPAHNHLEDSSADELEGNLMVAAVEPYTFTSSDPIDQVFIMSLTHYTYNSTTGEWSEQKEADVEGFYRLRYEEGGTHNTIGANKAYMLLDVGSVALWNQTGDGPNSSNVQVFFAEDINSIHHADDATGIETINIDGEQNDGGVSHKYVFYTLSGVRLNGMPQVPGLYICNGKKVMVK